MKPDPTIMNELLKCDPINGRLWWKLRDRRWFPDDGHWKTWNTRYAGKEAFTAIRDNGYLIGSVFDHRYRAHHVIWCIMCGFWPIELDHIDGNRRNNSLLNLRHVNRQMNTRNSAKNRNNKSGFTGVRLSGKRWVAEICVDYRNIVLGRYDNLAEAVATRKNAEQIYGFHRNHGRNAHNDHYDRYRTAPADALHGIKAYAAINSCGLR